MLGLNRVTLMGEVAEKPELRYTPEGTAVAVFTVAVSRACVPAHARAHREMDWFNVVAWRELAEQCAEEFDEGTLIYLEGRLRNHVWRDAVGRQVVRTEIIAERSTVLGQDMPESESRDDYDCHWRD